METGGVCGEKGETSLSRRSMGLWGHFLAGSGLWAPATGGGRLGETLLEARSWFWVGPESWRQTDPRGRGTSRLSGGPRGSSCCGEVTMWGHSGRRTGSNMGYQVRPARLKPNRSLRDSQMPGRTDRTAAVAPDLTVLTATWCSVGWFGDSWQLPAACQICSAHLPCVWPCWL